YTIDELKTIISENPGNCNLKLNVSTIYEDRVLNVSMLARKTKIDPSDELIKKLDEVEGLRYKVLT
ncbi:MAG: hypothetical protein WBA74_25640, partial [Cyclobacteriaceae bacterium]